MRQNMLALCIPFLLLSPRFVKHVSLYHIWGRFVNPLNLKILGFRLQTHCTPVADKSHTRRPDAYVNADSNPNLEGIGP